MPDSCDKSGIAPLLILFLLALTLSGCTSPAPPAQPEIWVPRGARTEDLASYDPEGKLSGVTKLEQAKVEKLTVQGAARRQGDLEVEQLHLDRGLLYVDGNLKVTDGFHGLGTVVTTGNFSGTGAIDLDPGPNATVVVVGGRLELHADPDTPGVLKGRVAASDTDLAHITIQGTLVGLPPK